MKQLLYILIFTLASLTAAGQDLISRTTEIQAAGGVFYLVDSAAYDNGTAFPDVEVRKTLIGDTSRLLNYLVVEAEKEQRNIALKVAEAFKRGRANAVFNDYRSIYNQVAGKDIFTAMEDRFYDDYRGTYRVFDLAADSSFVASLVRLGADNRYRLEHETTGERWAVFPKSERNFLIAGWQGQNYDMYDDGITRKGGTVRVFEPAGRVGAPGTLRIVKISNR